MNDISHSLRKHYANTFKSFGATSEGVDWGHDSDRLNLRYEKMLALSSDLTKDGVSLLDVGCGFGGLLDYASGRNISLNYTGIDVVDDMIKYAEKNTNETARFIIGDILCLADEEKFDYIVCNGILTQKLDASGSDMDQYANRLIKKMFAMCREGIAFNIMSTKVNFFSNNLYYRNSAELLAWCMSEISPYIKVDHSYPLYEYTVYIYRTPR